MMELNSEYLRDDDEPYYSMKCTFEDFQTKIQKIETQDRELTTILEDKIVSFTQNIQNLTTEIEQNSSQKKLIKFDQKEIDRDKMNRKEISSDLKFLKKKKMIYSKLTNSTVEAVKDDLKKCLD